MELELEKLNEKENRLLMLMNFLDGTIDELLMERKNLDEVNAHDVDYAVEHLNNTKRFLQASINSLIEEQQQLTYRMEWKS